MADDDSCPRFVVLGVTPPATRRARSARSTRRAKAVLAANRRHADPEAASAAGAAIHFGPGAGDAVAVPSALIAWTEGLVAIDRVEFPEFVAVDVPTGGASAQKLRAATANERVALPPLVAMVAALVRRAPIGWLLATIPLPFRPHGVAYRPHDRTLLVQSRSECSVRALRLALPDGPAPDDPETPTIEATVCRTPPMEAHSWKRSGAWHDALGRCQGVAVDPATGAVLVDTGTKRGVQAIAPNLQSVVTDYAVPSGHCRINDGVPVWALRRRWEPPAVMRCHVDVPAPEEPQPTPKTLPPAATQSASAPDDAPAKPVSVADALPPAPKPEMPRWPWYFEETARVPFIPRYVKGTFTAAAICPYSNHVIAAGLSDACDPVLVPFEAVQSINTACLREVPATAASHPIALQHVVGPGAPVSAKGVATDGHGHWVVADQDGDRLLVIC